MGGQIDERQQVLVGCWLSRNSPATTRMAMVSHIVESASGISSFGKRAVIFLLLGDILEPQSGSIESLWSFSVFAVGCQFNAGVTCSLVTSIRCREERYLYESILLVRFCRIFISTYTDSRAIHISERFVMILLFKLTSGSLVRCPSQWMVKDE